MGHSSGVLPEKSLHPQFGRHLPVRVRLGLKESWFLDFVDHHQVLSTLRHGLVPCSPPLEEIVESLQLLELGNAVVYILFGELSHLGYLSLGIGVERILQVLLFLTHC